MQIISVSIYCSFLLLSQSGKKNKALRNISGREEQENFLWSQQRPVSALATESRFRAELVPSAGSLPPCLALLPGTHSPCRLWPQTFPNGNFCHLVPFHSSEGQDGDCRSPFWQPPPHLSLSPELKETSSTPLSVSTLIYGTLLWHFFHAAPLGGPADSWELA